MIVVRKLLNLLLLGMGVAAFYFALMAVLPSTSPKVFNSLEAQMHVGVPLCILDSNGEQIAASKETFRFKFSSGKLFKELSAEDRKLYMKEMGTTAPALFFGKARPSTIAYVGQVTSSDGSGVTYPAFLAFFRTDDNKTCMYSTPLTPRHPSIPDIVKRYE